LAKPRRRRYISTEFQAMVIGDIDQRYGNGTKVPALAETAAE